MAPKFVIDQVLPVGLTMLHGKPKAGKSWLSLEMAAAVASGGKVLGYQAEQGGVLLCLEETPRRPIPALVDARFTLNPAPLGMDVITLIRNGSARIVVIDPVEMVIPKHWGPDEQESWFRALRAEAFIREIAILLVHTTRRVAPVSPLGTLLVVGYTEMLAELRKGTLYMHGRAVQDLVVHVDETIAHLNRQYDELAQEIAALEGELSDPVNFGDPGLYQDLKHDLSMAHEALDTVASELQAAVMGRP